MKESNNTDERKLSLCRILARVAGLWLAGVMGTGLLILYSLRNHPVAHADLFAIRFFVVLLLTPVGGCVPYLSYEEDDVVGWAAWSVLGLFLVGLLVSTLYAGVEGLLAFVIAYAAIPVPASILYACGLRGRETGPYETLQSCCNNGENDD